MNIYPENSRDHRDCALATTFLLGTINAYPKCRGELSPAMRKLKQILFEIRDSLKIKKYSAGEERDIHAAIDSAEAHGFCYFEDAEPAAQYKSWHPRSAPLSKLFAAAAVQKSQHRLCGESLAC